MKNSLKRFIFLSKTNGSGYSILSDEKPTRFKKPRGGWTADIVPQRKSFKTNRTVRLNDISDLTYVGYFPGR